MLECQSTMMQSDEQVRLAEPPLEEPGEERAAPPSRPPTRSARGRTRSRPGPSDRERPRTGRGLPTRRQPRGSAGQRRSPSSAAASGRTGSASPRRCPASIRVGGPDRSARKVPLSVRRSSAGREVRRRRRAERDSHRRRGEQATDRRPDELVHRELDAPQAAVGRREAVVVADDIRQHRLGGRIEQRLEDAEEERDDVEEPDRRYVGYDCHGEPAEQGDSARGRRGPSFGAGRGDRQGRPR